MNIDYMIVTQQQLKGKLLTLVSLTLITGFWLGALVTAFLSGASVLGSYLWFGLISFVILLVCWSIFGMSFARIYTGWKQETVSFMQKHELKLGQALNKNEDVRKKRLQSFASCRHSKLTSTISELHTLMTSHLSNITGETNEAALSLINQLKLIYDAMSYLLETVSANREQSDEIASGSQTTLVDNQKTMDRLQTYIDRRLLEIEHDHQMASELQEQAGIMSNLTKLIETVAKQTTIVATNAKIEATRAGAFGKAFGVIADEVTNLSAKIGDSSKQIIESIDHMGRSIEDKFKAKLDKTTQVEETNLLNSLKNQLVNIGESYTRLERFNRDTLDNINGSSEQIKSKVNDSLMAIQFQDITQQQIEVILKSLHLFEKHLTQQTCIELADTKEETYEEFDINQIRNLYVMKKQHDIHNKHHDMKRLNPDQSSESDTGDITLF